MFRRPPSAKMDRVGVGHYRVPRVFPWPALHWEQNCPPRSSHSPPSKKSAHIAKVSHHGDFSASAKILLPCGSLSTPLKTTGVALCMTNSRPQASVSLRWGLLTGREGSISHTTYRVSAGVVWGCHVAKPGCF